MSSAYAKFLEASKRRYEEKLLWDGTLLPDPLDAEIRAHVFKSPLSYPPVTIGDVYKYVVNRECTYTHQKVVYYKELDSYNFFISGKVFDILIYISKSLQVSVLTCTVKESLELKNFYTPWVTLKVTGDVVNGHCNCMAGLDEVCSHVGALLWTIESTIRERYPACIWKKTAKRVHSLRVTEINFGRKRKKDVFDL